MLRARGRPLTLSCPGFQRLPPQALLDPSAAWRVQGQRPHRAPAAGLLSWDTPPPPPVKHLLTRVPARVPPLVGGWWLPALGEALPGSCLGAFGTGRLASCPARLQAVGAAVWGREAGVLQGPGSRRALARTPSNEAPAARRVPADPGPHRSSGTCGCLAGARWSASGAVGAPWSPALRSQPAVSACCRSPWWLLAHRTRGKAVPSLHQP